MRTIEVKITIRIDDSHATPIAGRMAAAFASHMAILAALPPDSPQRAKLIAEVGDECKGRIESDYANHVVEWQAYVDGKVASNDPAGHRAAKPMPAHKEGRDQPFFGPDGYVGRDET